MPTVIHPAAHSMIKNKYFIIYFTKQISVCLHTEEVKRNLNIPEDGSVSWTSFSLISLGGLIEWGKEVEH